MNGLDNASLKKLLDDAQEVLKDRLTSGVEDDSTALVKQLFEVGRTYGLTEREICVSLLHPLKALFRGQ